MSEARALGPIRRFAELDSTNRYLMEEAAAGAPAGLVAVAAHQLAGRGRLGRRWEAPPGTNLLVSVLLRPEVPAESLHLCTVVVALAAADACLTVAGVEPELKWPNDLVVGPKKLAGILAESSGLPGDGRSAASSIPAAVVVGLGLNVGWPPAASATASAGDGVDDGELALVAAGATSIVAELAAGRGAHPGVVEGDRPLPALVEELLGAVLAGVWARLAELDTVPGRLTLSSEFRARCSTLGRAVSVDLGHGVVRGVAADLTAEGHLVVDTGTCLRTVAAGDVVHVLPPGGSESPF